MSGSFVGREMPAANCDVSSESGRGRVGFLSPSPKGHTVAQVISQDPWDLTANGLSSSPVVPLSFFLHLHSFSSSYLFPSSPPVLPRPSLCSACSELGLADLSAQPSVSRRVLAHYYVSFLTAVHLCKMNLFLDEAHTADFHKHKLCHNSGLLRISMTFIWCAIIHICLTTTSASFYSTKLLMISSC